MSVPDYIGEAAAFRARVPLKTMTVDGLVWPYIDQGQGADALLLCPGTLGHADVFRNVIEHFAPRMRVIAVTYPMVGDVGRIAEGAIGLLDRLGVGQVNILGSSLGGIVVQTIAARHPDRIAHAFIANSLADLSPMRTTFPPPAVAETMPAAAAKAAVGGNVASWPEPAPEFAAIKAYLLDELAHHFTGRAFKARVLALVRLAEIPTAAIPQERITILEADDDPLITPEVRRGVTARYPDAFVHAFASGGHYPYIVRPEEYCRVMEQRLAG